MIRKMVIRYILLNKRLLRKYSFLLILCLVPLLVAGMRLAAQEESGLMRVALYVEDDREELTAGILEKLADRRGVLHFVRCHSEQAPGRCSLDHSEGSAGEATDRCPEPADGGRGDSGGEGGQCIPGIYP